MLAEHPEVYARLRREVLDTLGSNRKVGPDNLRSMTYLRAVLNGKRDLRTNIHIATWLTGVTRNATFVSERVSLLNLLCSDDLILNGNTDP